MISIRVIACIVLNVSNCDVFLYLGHLCPLASEETCQSGWFPSLHPSSLSSKHTHTHTLIRQAQKVINYQ